MAIMVTTLVYMKTELNCYLIDTHLQTLLGMMTFTVGKHNRKLQISKTLLKKKDKLRAPAYSCVLRQVRRAVNRYQEKNKDRMLVDQGEKGAEEMLRQALFKMKEIGRHSSGWIRVRILV